MKRLVMRRVSQLLLSLCCALVGIACTLQTQRASLPLPAELAFLNKLELIGTYECEVTESTERGVCAVYRDKKMRTYYAVFYSVSGEIEYAWATTSDDIDVVARKLIYTPKRPQCEGLCG